MRHILYGDGLHDDAPAIQEMLDTSTSEVCLPPAKTQYMIGSTLRIHSNQRLVLPRYTVIRLMDGVSSPMVENADPMTGNRNLGVTGGIWDMNNMGQEPNPVYSPKQDTSFVIGRDTNHNPCFPDVYIGVGMRFANIRNFELSNLTCKDPVTYCVQMAHMDQFTVENILFDMNLGNPEATNMDGIHLEGPCRHGLIRNLRGACYDDLVALNADEYCSGPIEDIVVEDLFAEGCHSAVRLLSVSSPVRRIHISRVFGTYYQYCVAFSKYYRRGNGVPGQFEDITLLDFYVSKAERLPLFAKVDSYVYPLFWFQTETETRNLTMENISRVERTTPVAMIGIDQGASVTGAVLRSIRQRSEISQEFPLLENLGTLGYAQEDEIIMSRIPAAMEGSI